MNNEIKKIHKIVNLDGLNISYSYQPRLKFGPNISIIFLSGYMSDMFGTKANFLDKLSRKIGFEYLRFDYSGHGSSEGKIENQLLSDWVNQSYLLIKKKLNHPVIIVGSSLGGWIALILLNRFKKNILGFIVVGAAPDFTNDIIKNLSSIQKKRYMDTGYISIKSDYGEKPYKFTKMFIEDSKKNFVLLKRLEINTKITLLYGLQDSAVTLETQISLLKLLKTKNAKLIILNNSDHRMSSNYDLNLLGQTIKNMIKGTL